MILMEIDSNKTLENNIDYSRYKTNKNKTMSKFTEYLEQAKTVKTKGVKKSSSIKVLEDGLEELFFDKGNWE